MFEEASGITQIVNVTDICKDRAEKERPEKKGNHEPLYSLQDILSVTSFLKSILRADTGQKEEQGHKERTEKYDETADRSIRLKADII